MLVTRGYALNTYSRDPLRANSVQSKRNEVYYMYTGLYGTLEKSYGIRQVRRRQLLCYLYQDRLNYSDTLL